MTSKDTQGRYWLTPTGCEAVGGHVPDSTEQACVTCGAAVPRCPECTNGKHANCDGRALHPDTDEVVRCACTNALCSTPERNLA